MEVANLEVSADFASTINNEDFEVLTEYSNSTSIRKDMDALSISSNVNNESSRMHKAKEEFEPHNYQKKAI